MLIQDFVCFLCIMFFELERFSKRKGEKNNWKFFIILKNDSRKILKPFIFY
jgi:hypothetical protein